LNSNGPADLITSNPAPIEELVRKGKVVPAPRRRLCLPDLAFGSGRRRKAGHQHGCGYKAACWRRSPSAIARCSGTHARTDRGARPCRNLEGEDGIQGAGPVVEYLARGDFEIGIQQTNIMVGAPGTDMSAHCPDS